MQRIVIMGVAGCGKSSVGAEVSKQTGIAYTDGDDLHPPENIAKMSAGTPLNDDDRAPWLARVGQSLQAAPSDLMIGCSALKRSYRDIIRKKAKSPVHFIHLAAPIEVIRARMSDRTGHFMPPALLDSQFATLEPLQQDEEGTVIDIAHPFTSVVFSCIAALKADSTSSC